jgi:hypothetical protein
MALIAVQFAADNVLQQFLVRLMGKFAVLPLPVPPGVAFEAEERLLHGHYRGFFFSGLFLFGLDEHVRTPDERKEQDRQNDHPDLFHGYFFPLSP